MDTHSKIELFNTETGKFFCSDAIDKKIVSNFRNKGSHGKDEIECLLYFLNENSVVFDVGAHIGTFTVPLAKRVGEVHSFEMNPVNLDLLSKNIKINGITNVSIENRPVSDEVSLVKINAQEVSGMTYATKSIEGDKPTMTLDEKSALKPDLIKIDIEGFEYKALAGATSILKSKPILFIEYTIWGLERAGDSREALQKLLNKNDYRLYLYLNGKNHTFARIPSLKYITNQRATSNILCLPTGHKIPSQIKIMTYSEYLIWRIFNRLKRITQVG